MRISFLLLFPLVLSGCTQVMVGSHMLKKTREHAQCVAEGAPKVGNPYLIDGERYTPQNSSWGFAEEGIASWYGEDFHGRATANGECYNMYTFTAAHRTLPLPTVVRVTNLENNKSVVVKVNDRGPFARGRIIDLSYAAAQSIGMVGKGTAPVKIEALGGAFHGREATRSRRVTPLKRGDSIAATLPTTVPTTSGEEELAPLTPQAAQTQADAMQDLGVKPAPQNLPAPPAYEERVFTDATLLKKTLAYVQVGAFADAERATAEQLKLQTLYPTAHMSAVQTYAATLSRVRAGPFRSLADAEAALDKIVAAGFNAAQIKIEQR